MIVGAPNASSTVAMEGLPKISQYVLVGERHRVSIEQCAACRWTPHSLSEPFQARPRCSKAMETTLMPTFGFFNCAGFYVNVFQELNINNCANLRSDGRASSYFQIDKPLARKITDLGGLVRTSSFTSSAVLGGKRRIHGGSHSHPLP